MKSKIFSILNLPIAMLALMSATPSHALAQSAEAATTTLRAATGIGSDVVASAVRCPNISCTTAHTCTFVTLTGTLAPFSHFGVALTKANVLACLVIDQTGAVPNGQNAAVVGECDPTSGTAVVTGKAGSIVNISFAGNTCTTANPAAVNKNLLEATYIITDSTAKGITSGSGNLSAGFDTTLKAGTFTFNGNTD